MKNHYSLRSHDPLAGKAVWELLQSILIETGANRYRTNGTVLEPNLSQAATAAYQRVFGRRPKWFDTRWGPRRQGELTEDVEEDLAVLAPHVQSVEIFDGPVPRGGAFDAATVASAPLSPPEWEQLADRIAHFVDENRITVNVI